MPSLTTTTTTIKSAPSASDVAEGSEIAEDYIEWEEEYEDVSKKSTPWIIYL